MKDRMDFLQILSLLIASAFLIVAITPVSASAETDRQTRLTSILAAHRAADTSVGHEIDGYAMASDSAWPSRAIAPPSFYDREALFRGTRTGPDSPPDSGFALAAASSSDPGFTMAAVREPASGHRNTRMYDLIRVYHETRPGMTRIYSGEGTVRFIDLEGGFFGIVTSSGEQFIPDNLPRALMSDGITIRFTAIIGDETPGIAMWGRAIHLISCERIDRTFSKEGTVRYIDLEGGFYGIITATGEKYLPINLPPEFRVDGLLVEFTARERLDISTTVLWGIPVEVTDITKLDASSVPVVLEFSRTGGFAGCSDYLIVYEDGSARLDRKEYTTLFRLPDDTFDRLEHLIASVDVSKLRNNYRAPQQGADLFTYSLTCKGKTIHLEETAVPVTLDPIIDLLCDIITANGPDDIAPPFLP